jgi:hypothetical protein
MNTPSPRRRARKGEVVARVAVVIGLAAAAGVIGTGGLHEAGDNPAQQSACVGWLFAPLTAL